MTITIPTGELVGLLSDVIPMADHHKDAPSETHCVRIEWDGTQLHALATDRYKIGWSTWSADDDLEGEPNADALATEWGGADDPWSATIELDDAKHLVKTYKLGAKAYFTPLTVEHINPGAVRIMRSKDTGHSAISTVVRDTFVEFLNVREVLARKDTIAPSTGFDLNAQYVAAFAKVRPRGPMVLRFTGRNSLIHVSIGQRFVGALLPILDTVRLGKTPETAGDVLRHGSGVLVGAAAGGGSDG